MTDAPFWAVAQIEFTHHVPDPVEGDDVLRKRLNLAMDHMTVEPPDLVFWRGGTAVYRCGIGDVAAVGISEGTAGPVRGTPEYIEMVREKSSQAYQRWTVDEESRLRELFNGGTPVPQIASELGRQTGAIRSRLAKLGLYESSPAEA